MVSDEDVTVLGLNLKCLQ